MGVGEVLVGLAAGFVIAVVTTPVGVSGALFLLPIQLDLLKVPNPAVTPTNLLYNVVSTPGALVRYWRQGQHPGELARWMLAGTIPGVVLGAVVRVFVIPDVRTFRLVAAAVLLPIGIWLIVRAVRRRPPRPGPGLRAGRVGLLGGLVGVAGGVYGIGGGSLLAPILVARGVPVATVAPAALAATFVTSVVGAVTFAVLALSADGATAPAWALGLVCGLGGLAGGFVGARVGRRLPERALTLLLGVIAAALAVFYVAQALR